MTAWTDHVKAYAKEHNVSYKTAMKEARRSYHKNANQNGEGIADVVNRVKDAYYLKDDPKGTPSVRAAMKAYGDYKITKIDINRNPVPRVATNLLNAFTSGKIVQYLKTNDYDDLYHLFAVVHLEGGKLIQVEKNERVLISTKITKLSSKGGTISVNVPEGLTFNELMDNTMKQMGESFFLYRGSNWNCQHFLSNLVSANDLMTKELNRFINQDVEDILKTSPFVISLMNKITDTAKGVDILLHGKGDKQKKTKLKS